MNSSAEPVALVPSGVVTLTETVPLTSLGETAVMEVSLFTVKLLAAVAPKATAVAPVKPVPVMITLVPPAFRPEVGEMAGTAGAIAMTAVALLEIYVPQLVKKWVYCPLRG